MNGALIDHRWRGARRIRLTVSRSAARGELGARSYYRPPPPAHTPPPPHLHGYTTSSLTHQTDGKPTTSPNRKSGSSLEFRQKKRQSAFETKQKVVPESGRRAVRNGSRCTQRETAPITERAYYGKSPCTASHKWLSLKPVAGAQIRRLAPKVVAASRTGYQRR
eukprot:scaffold6748_cov122-Isochrysis_galbana.AAC.7